MSTLTLVRHGQALPFQADADRLSELGREQTRQLAQYWLRRGFAMDEMVTGSLRRLRETAKILREALAPAAFRVDARFNEYDSARIQRELAPQLAAADPEFAATLQSWNEHRGAADQNRYFQKMFEALLEAWHTGAKPLPGVESWADFHRRVQDGLREIQRAPGRSRRVVVITSGCPIGVAVQEAVGAPTAAAIDIHWRMRNCSLTEFLYSETRISLDLFNATPHLEPLLVSYR